MGVVVRDCNGKVLVSKCRNVKASYQPSIAEAIAILDGIWIAVSEGLFPVVVESDALVVVQAINSRNSPFSELGVVVDDILAMMDIFPGLSISFAPRVLNKVALGLAKLALDFEGVFLWIEDCPLCVESLVRGDVPFSL